MNKMDLIRQNMAKRQERTLDALADNKIRSTGASVPLSKIDLNPNNQAAENDSEEGIRQLADDISTVGLLHNLVVNDAGDGRYLLISGERRFKALRLLGWEYAPCVVYDRLPDAMIRVMTVLANLEAREYSAGKRLQLYTELDSQLRILKDMGIYRGGIGKGIAQIMGVSENQIVKYRKLTQGMSPEELGSVTNINKAYEQLKAETSSKNHTQGDFFEGDDNIKKSADSENAPKNPTEGDFFEDDDSIKKSDDPEYVQKNPTEGDFFDGVDSITESDDSENTPKNSPQVNKFDDVDSMTESDDSNVYKYIPSKVRPIAGITVQEVNINWEGYSFLCAFGRHINGAWIAILNFGVSAELSKFDVSYNTAKIKEALKRSADFADLRIDSDSTAQFIAEIVTNLI